MKKIRRRTGATCILAFLLCLAILGTNCAMSYDSVINGVLGINVTRVETLETDEEVDTTYFKSAYGELTSKNLKTLKNDSYAQAVQEQEEGTVLLKNDNNALPLAADERNVTLFGHAIVQPLYRNQSAGSRAWDGMTAVDLFKALGQAKFKVNSKLYQAYRSSKTERKTGTGSFFSTGEGAAGWSLGEEPISFYTDQLRATWENDFNDAAIVMLAREGGEGVELYMETPTEGISQLALSQDEKDLLAMIRDCGKFKKTIVLINSGNPMELDWLDEYEVDAALWIGCPGEKGFTGVANILTGAANPSGHLIETYAADSLSSPAAHTGSYNNQTWANLDEALQKSVSSPSEISYYTVQTEGIYIGYKYYETRYEDAILNRFNAAGSAGSSFGDKWNYADEIVFPFGHGLSYTTFEQTLDSVVVGEKDVVVTVTVTNTGAVAGKSVVQVYAQTPYGKYEQDNLVEKSAIQLLDFGKTALLEPGASETLTITADKYLLASYDYKKAKGYILSEGDYYIAIGNDAHDALNNVLAAKGATGMVDAKGNAVTGNAKKTFTWNESFNDSLYKHSVTGTLVTNRFDDCDVNYWFDDKVTYLTRSDWQGTFPTEPVMGLELTDEMIRLLDGDLYEKPANAPSVASFTQGENQGLMLISMMGVDYDDPLWDTFMNQLTIEEMASLIANNFGTDELASVGKPTSPAGDGPDGIGGYSDNFDKKKYGGTNKTTSFPNESLLTASFNKELYTKRGEQLGEEGLFLGVVEIWGPGANLHRTPFGGRSFEYFSEDANLNYLAAAPIVAAIESKGVHAGPKHLTGNDQENNRQGVVNFFNEQAFREGALRGLEGGVVNGGAQSLMQAFNRLGFLGCSLSEELNRGVVRAEWGYEGHIETDAIGVSSSGYKTAFATMLNAGTDSFCLDTQRQSPAAIIKEIQDNNDGHLLEQLRRAAKNILYNDANSNLMNGLNSNSVIIRLTPWWQPALQATIGVVAFATLVSLMMLTAAKIKYRKEQKGAVQ